MIVRTIFKEINRCLFQGKVIMILGPRQGGKTTLMQQIANEHGAGHLWLNADEREVREQLSNANESKLRRIAGNNKLVFIDEAQRIENIGLCLKIFADRIQEVQVIATGSAAFELSDKIKEPLTGRKFEFHLYPISIEELILHTGEMEVLKNLEMRLIHGSYPEVINKPGEERETLTNIADSFLYKDVLAFGNIKKPDLIERLLQALALQMGSEVSYNELAQTIGADKETVERYMLLLEQAFVIYQLPAFSRNVRNELKKARKVFFYDNGIRNALISNFSTLETRPDKGQLWENFLVTERMKFLDYHGVHCNRYFWRTTQQQEIDYIEDRDGILYAYEFKYSSNKEGRFPKTFAKAYPESSFDTVNQGNFLGFVRG